MRYSKLSGMGPLLAVIASLASAADLEPMSGAELRQRCLAYIASPQSATGQACSGYVRGFIEGSTVTQVGVSTSGGESFTDRALRTRLGMRADPQPTYCVDATVSLSHLISQILRLLDEQPNLIESNARDVLHQVLQRFHRCRA